MKGYRGFLLAGILAVNASAAFASNVDVVFYDNRFGVLNDVTGAYTQLGTLPVSVSSGIASMNGLMYLEDTGLNLFSVDPVSAASHLIGQTGVSDNAAVFGGGPGGLFEVDYASNLYSLNASTGQARLIGATGLAANNGNYDTSLSMSGNSLYYTQGASGANDELYRINITTGVALDLGNTGVTGVAGSALVNGNLELYQYGQSTNYLYSAPAGTVNFARGAVLGASIIDGGTVVNSVSGGSTQNSVTPEPGSIVLAASGLLLLGYARRKRQLL